MTEARIYRSDDGREWTVTLDSPGKILSVQPSLERSGANLPEHQIRIVFTSGEDSLSEEYTAFTLVEDLSDDDLREWFDAATEGRGV
ncbi:hypothetical protein BH23GEM6_BH23GEM6_02000 [soil metagenome]